MFADAGDAGAVGPGARGVSFGRKGSFDWVATGPASGSAVNPPGGSLVKILYDSCYSELGIANRRKRDIPL